MELNELLKLKLEYSKERDLCAELYNVWITKLHDFQHDPELYDMYMRVCHFEIRFFIIWNSLAIDLSL